MSSSGDAPEGASDTILALHGFLGRGADWRPVADALGADVRLLAPDLPGHGAAVGAPPEAFSFGGTLAALAQHLDEAGVRRAHVAGYSMGGRLALGFALRHPERTASLALFGASAGLPDAQARAARRALDATRGAAIRADFPAFLRAWYRMPLFGTLTDAQRERLVADRLAHGAPEALARALAGLGTGTQPWLGEQLHALRVPVVAVAGARDAKFVALAKGFADSGRVRTVVVPDAGHALLAEAPAAVAAILRELTRPVPARA